MLKWAAASWDALTPRRLAGTPLGSGICVAGAGTVALPLGGLLISRSFCIVETVVVV
jgi:hypothetical protein